MPTHQIEFIGDRLVRKRFASSARGEPRREWLALTLLHARSPGLAPEPISASFEDDPPSMTMTRLPGQPVDHCLVTGSHDAELAAITEALHRLFTAVPPAEASRLDPCLGHPRRRIDGIRTGLAALIPPDDPTVTAAHRLSLRWLAGDDAQAFADGDGPPILGRADHNLPNFLYDGGTARLVDFEDSGRSDRAIELALLIEHIASRAVDDPAWTTLIRDFSLGAAERTRFEAMRRLEAMFWLRLLMPGQPAAARNPPGALHRQARRVLSLF